MNPPATTVAYFGPAATFTQEALLTQSDLAGADLRPLPTITAVLEEVAGGKVDLGFVPIENAIEGTVSATIDGLIFDVDLYIQREVVMDIHLHLMARPGTRLADVGQVSSYPHALAQCQKFLAGQVPAAVQVAANSTADAARVLGESEERGAAAIAPRLAAERYGLVILAEDVEDHPENQTRFVAVARRSGAPSFGTRQDQHRLLPAGRPPRQPARNSRTVRRAQHQPDQTRVTPDETGAGRLLLRHRPERPRR